MSNIFVTDLSILHIDFNDQNMQYCNDLDITCSA